MITVSDYRLRNVNTDGQECPSYGVRGRYFARRLFVAFLICGALAGCGGSPPAKANPQSTAKKAKLKAAKTAAVTSQSGSSQAEPAKIVPAEIPENAKIVQKIHRPKDDRPKRDDLKLTERGFVKVTSDRLILYSDLPVKELEGLTDAVAQLYSLMEAYFGPLPPPDGDNPIAYQMTGYLMADAQRFRDAGILTEGPAQPHEGWYLGNEFWWNQQATPYYTRHLMLHEATHCFMHVMPSVDCPPWYVEGMAELFGTHLRDDKGKYIFGIMPDSSDRCPGWSRVSVLQDEIAAGKLPSVDEILAYRFDDYAKLQPYAWSWALCHFLNTHPRYQPRFRDLAKQVMNGGFVSIFDKLFRPLKSDLRDEWLLFASQIQYAHDIERSALDFQPGVELAASGKPTAVTISADHGWQPTRVKLIAGKKYRVRATGRFTLATTTKPWISEPQGISIRYFAGQPLGRLMSLIRPEPTADPANRDILKLIPLGTDTTFVASHSGT
ncbi:MAG: hypothetical protein JWN70_5007, partial [Planctomycetaceae bacterium]|nr:hypothetical protein [Planctomycetaceae bacterium]